MNGAQTPWPSHPYNRPAPRVSLQAAASKPGIDSELPALADATRVKDARLGDPALPQRLLQDLGWLVDLLRRQDPGTPVDAHGSLALRVLEDLYRVERVRVYGTPQEARLVGADRD